MPLALPQTLPNNEWAFYSGTHRGTYRGAWQKRRPVCSPVSRARARICTLRPPLNTWTSMGSVNSSHTSVQQVLPIGGCRTCLPIPSLCASKSLYLVWYLSSPETTLQNKTKQYHVSVIPPSHPLPHAPLPHCLFGYSILPSLSTFFFRPSNATHTVSLPNPLSPSIVSQRQTVTNDFFKK